MDKIVEIWSDGASKGNPGPGGWGAVLFCGQNKKEIYGGEYYTTNNRMELTATVEALKLLRHKCKVAIHTDSQYVKNGITKWIHTWKKNGWKTTDKKPVKNEELWKELDDLVQQHDIKWQWVRGHSGIAKNERADELANLGVDQILQGTSQKAFIKKSTLSK